MAVEISRATRKAAVLLTGGLDATTTLAIARHIGYAPYAITFRYGQRHLLEIDAAWRVGERASAADPVAYTTTIR